MTPAPSETPSTDDELKRALVRVLAPLVEADGGELYWLPISAGSSGGQPPTVVRLHLTGRFSGCPGNGLVTDHVLRPVVAAVLPQARLEVTSGALVPAGAERLHAEASDSHRRTAEPAAG
ncbi:MAG TPA: hypothetical protein VLC09_10165 [Polyangiaceae bacterium]|nr:hypothetical protein [Polyangiaceae bacterium]